MAAILSRSWLQAIRPHQQPVPLDPWLLLGTGGLVMLGIIMVASSSLPVAQAAGAPFYYLTRHLVALGLGLILALLLYRADPARLEKYSPFFALAAFMLLLLPFIPGLGVRINGANRWIRLLITNFQVVEAVKLCLVVFLAGFCVRRAWELQNRLTGILKPLGVALLMVGALLMQPDFGGAVLVLTITIGMIWLAGASRVRLGLLAASLVPALLAIAWLEPYRIKRMVSFLDPWADPFKDGFQLTQALIAVGRGEWFGVGLGQSVQKLHYLPEAYTDFIVAVLAEELGFFGIALTVLLFAIVAGRCFMLGLEAVRREKFFLGYCGFGIGIWIAAQSLVSMGVNLGMLPTKGLTLPLISSGGSSAMLTLAALGLVFRISAELRRPGAAPVPGGPSGNAVANPIGATP